MIDMTTVLEEEKRKFPWFYQFRVSKEVKDRFERGKEAQKTD